MEAGTPWGLSKSFAERGENWAGPGEKEKSRFQEKEIVVSLRAVGPSWKVEGTLGAWAVGVAGPGREGPGGGGTGEDWDGEALWAAGVGLCIHS